MKRRTINPEFFTDTKTGRLSPTSQILFIGLWCLADREGYIENDPDFIKIQILPYAKSSIRNNLQELVASNLVITCNYNGKNLLYITNFLKHQPIHPHEAKSPYPSIDSMDVITCNDMSLPPNYIYKGKDKDKGKDNDSKKRAKKNVNLDFISDPKFGKLFLQWINYKKTQFNFIYKSEISMATAYDELIKLSNGDFDIASEIVGKSIANGWKGLFGLKEKDSKQNQSKTKAEKSKENMMADYREYRAKMEMPNE